jgi:hypothetical protein
MAGPEEGVREREELEEVASRQVRADLGLAQRHAFGELCRNFMSVELAQAPGGADPALLVE